MSRSRTDVMLWTKYIQGEQIHQEPSPGPVFPAVSNAPSTESKRPRVQNSQFNKLKANFKIDWLSCRKNTGMRTMRIGPNLRRIYRRHLNRRLRTRERRRKKSRGQCISPSRRKRKAIPSVHLSRIFNGRSSESTKCAFRDRR